MNVFTMFGSIFLKDEASDKLDAIDKKGKSVGRGFDGLGRAALKASAMLATIGAASSGLVATSAPLLAAVGGLVASFGAAGIGALAFGAVAMGALAPVISGAENLTKAQQGARKELEAFQSFWGGFVKQFETPVFEAFGASLTLIQNVLKGLAPTITAVSTVVVGLINNMNSAVAAGGLTEFFTWLEQNAARSLENFAIIFGNTMNGIFGLMKAFTPIGIQLETGLVSLTQRFAEWSNGLATNQGFQTFLTYVQTNTPIVMGILSNLWTILTGAIAALAPLGTAILGILQQLTATLISWSPLFMTIVQYVTDFANVINNNWSTVVDVFLAVGAAVATFLTIMKGLQIIGMINALMIAFRAGTVAATLAQWGLNAAMLANPITWIVALIALLVAAGVLLYRNWDTVKAKLLQLWSATVQAFNAIKAAVVSAWNQVSSSIQSGINRAKSAVTSGWNAVKSATTSAWNSIKSAVVSAWNNLTSAVRSGMNTVKSAVTSGWNAIRSVVSSVISTIVSVVTSGWNRLVSAIQSGMNNVKSAVTNGWNAVKSFLSSIDLSSIGRNIMQGLGNGIASAGKAVLEKARAIGNGIKDAVKGVLNINSPSRVMMEIGKGVGEGMEIGIGKSAKGVENASRDLGMKPIQAMDGQGSNSGGGQDNVSSLLGAVKTMLENFKVDLYMDSNLVGAGVTPTVSNRQGEQISRNKFFAGGDKK